MEKRNEKSIAGSAPPARPDVAARMRSWTAVGPGQPHGHAAPGPGTRAHGRRDSRQGQPWSARRHRDHHLGMQWIQKIRSIRQYRISKDRLIY